MATVREIIAEITGQLDKASTEITGAISKLEDQIATGNIAVEDLAPLKAAAQRLDDIVPDEAPAPEDNDDDPEDDDEL